MPLVVLVVLLFTANIAIYRYNIMQKDIAGGHQRSHMARQAGVRVLDTSFWRNIPDSKVHGANMGPTWVLSAPDGPHVGPMNLAIRDTSYHRWQEKLSIKCQDDGLAPGDTFTNRNWLIHHRLQHVKVIICIEQWDLIIHPCPNFNFDLDKPSSKLRHRLVVLAEPLLQLGHGLIGLVKPQLKSGHEWVITCLCFMWK